VTSAVDEMQDDSRWAKVHFCKKTCC